MGASRGLDHRLVGRAAEWAAAAEAIRLGRSGVLFAGPLGVGKTALARALAAELADDQETKTIWLHASAGASIPFGAFAPYLPDVAVPAEGGSDLLRLLQDFRRALALRASDRRLLLVVDDAHRLDTHSAALVFQLVASSQARAVLTVESGAAVPEAVRDLWKEQLVERLEVRPLPNDATVEMLADLLAAEEASREGADIRSAGRPYGPSVAGDATDAVLKLARGNPLYVRELVKWGCQSGWLVLRDGVWALEGELAVGPSLTELISHRLEALGATEVEALQLVAVAGAVPLRVLTAEVGAPPIEALAGMGLLSLERSGGEQVVGAAHPILAEVVRTTMGKPLAGRLGVRLADAFEADGRTEAEAVRIAWWRLEAGLEPPAPTLARAARIAGSRQDWRVSARLAEASLARDGGCEAALALADAYRALGRYQEALTILESTRGYRGEQVAREAVLKALVQYFGFGRLGDALDTLTAAESSVDGPSDVVWLRAVAAGVIGFSGDAVQAVERAEKLLTEPGLTPRAELTARAVLSLSLSWTGRMERALQVVEGIAPPADAVADLPQWNVTARVLGHRLSGQIDSLEKVAAASYELGVQLHDPRVSGPAAAALGWASLSRAHLPRAIRWFREATVALRSAGALTLRVPPLLGLAETLALTGDVDGARAALEEARPVAQNGKLLKPSWSVAAAWTDAAQGAMTEVFERLEQTAAECRADSLTASEIQALQSAVRLGSAAPAARLAELAEWVEGSLIHVLAGHAAALDGPGDRGASLDEVAERYADLGLNLFAAEAAAQACRAHQAAGHTRRAAASAARGHFLLGSTDEGPPPLGLALALTPPELTRREREVAMLAARGQPSQAIATRLCLSVRTVETHLARVYVKLGIGGRSELAVALVSGATGPKRQEAG